MTPLLADLRAGLRSLAAGEIAVSAEELPPVAAELAQAQAAVLVRAAQAPAPKSIAPPRTEEPQDGRSLTAAQAAEFLGKSRWWVWKHRESIPHGFSPSGRAEFSEGRLRRWKKDRGL